MKLHVSIKKFASLLTTELYECTFGEKERKYIQSFFLIFFLKYVELEELMT